MIKAKTSKKIFTIFCAIIGVVFAFITGVTYCPASISLKYGLSPTSTSAYMGNQQYHVINDTTKTPVLFGEGAHNFDIAIQYSYSYSFDVRVAYSMVWKDAAGEKTTLSTDNVILNFANRDNIIYDEDYIYLASSVDAGSGKVSLITGVEFTDPTDTTYAGKSLVITVDEVKIYKEQSSYGESHTLMKATEIDPETSEEKIVTLTGPAAQAWLQHKKNSLSTETTDAYVMMYNYRRDYEHGVPFPGLNSAYKKPVALTNYDVKTYEADGVTVKETNSYTANYVYAPVWTGGNRAYAGVGMYVVAGSTNLELEIQVEGIWRTSGEVDSTYENSIQFNYSDDWKFERYSENNVSEDQGLWEVRSFNFSIQAKQARYINILDSIEITSAGEDPTSSYRIVVREIIVNPASTNNTSFTYTSSSADYIKYAKIVSNNSSTTKSAYSQDDISVVNTTLYSNGLYDTLKPSLEYYNGNVTLINNTNATKILSVDLTLYYHISNGVSTLYNSNKLRAIDLIDRKKGTTTYNPEDAFNGDTKYSEVNALYYSCSKSSTSLANINGSESASDVIIKLAPYASVNLVTEYSVGSGLSTEVLDLFDDPTTNENSTYKNKEYYDVWTYIIPSIEDITSTTTETYQESLTLETTQTSSNTVISVKNNTNSTITGFSISNLSVTALGEEKYSALTVDDAPNDWSASYWKYYTQNADGKTYTPVTGAAPTYEANKYYERSQSYSSSNLTITASSDDTNKATTLLPGETVQVATVNTTAQVIVYGKVTAKSVANPTDVIIINNGTANAYIVNYSTETSYYLRMKGTATGLNIQKDFGDGYSYYIGVVRPGQIINISTSETLTIGTADKVTASGDYAASILEATTYDWNDNAIAVFTAYFNMAKEETTTE